MPAVSFTPVLSNPLHFTSFYEAPTFFFNPSPTQTPGTEAGFLSETGTEVKGERVRLRSVGDNRAGVIHAYDHSSMTVLHVRVHVRACLSGEMKPKINQKTS